VNALYMLVLFSFVRPSHFVSRPEHHWCARESICYFFTVILLHNQIPLTAPHQCSLVFDMNFVIIVNLKRPLFFALDYNRLQYNTIRAWTSTVLLFYHFSFCMIYKTTETSQLMKAYSMQVKHPLL
jgi:hypothetical protein